MERLIDADELADKIFNLCSDKNENWIGNDNQSFVDFDEVMQTINDMPTVDAVPVKRGKWIIGETLHHEWMKCSECLHSYDVTGVFSYCPNCGADMREVSE